MSATLEQIRHYYAETAKTLRLLEERVACHTLPGGLPCPGIVIYCPGLSNFYITCEELSAMKHLIHHVEKQCTGEDGADYVRTVPEETIIMLATIDLLTFIVQQAPIARLEAIKVQALQLGHEQTHSLVPFERLDSLKIRILSYIVPNEPPYYKPPQVYLLNTSPENSMFPALGDAQKIKGYVDKTLNVPSSTLSSGTGHQFIKLLKRPL